MMFRKAIAQAAVLGILSVAAALVFNAFSANGLNPFDDHSDVPVIEEPEAGAEEDAGREGIRYIELAELREMLRNGLIVLDARTRPAYEAGHIPGALLCDYYDMGHCLDVVLPLLSPYEKIGLYCSGPLCDDAEMLARELYDLGYRKLCVFRGGMEAWEGEGLPVEEGMPEVPR